MLKIRTIILSGIVAVFLVFTAQIVAAGTDSIPEPQKGAGNGAENQEVSTSLKKMYTIPEYRSQFGECADVSIAELAACRAESQSTVRGVIDDCFDVSLLEVASCRSANQSSAP
ncbi:MAG: hypothetical protein IH588_13650 [Anaerolineales bacterium]|nr:hypothetical protein [Anaerolineales bacterium]